MCMYIYRPEEVDIVGMAGRVSARWIGRPISSFSSIPNGNKRCSWAWAWPTGRWSRIRATLDFTGEISRAPDRMASSRPTGPTEAAAPPDDMVVQYVVLRRDLIDTWPMGSVVTQGCHASVAAIWSHKDDPHTLHYCGTSNLDSMHKVTLEVKGETQMLNLSEKLSAGGIAHKLWIEQPENIPTCLATKPYPKSMVSSYFKRLKLCK